MAVTHRVDPAVVDHQEGTTTDLNFIPGHRNDRGGAGGNTEHLHRHTAFVFTQKIVDGQAFEHVTARGVDIDRDVGAIHRP